MLGPGSLAPPHAASSGRATARAAMPRETRMERFYQPCPQDWVTPVQRGGCEAERAWWTRPASPRPGSVRRQPGVQVDVALVGELLQTLTGRRLEHLRLDVAVESG